MICRKCGSHIPEGQSVCQNCGMEVEKTVSAVVPSGAQGKQAQIFTPDPRLSQSQPISPAGRATNVGVQTKKGVNLKILIPCLCSAVALALIIVVVVLLAGRDVRRFERALQTGNQSEVRMMYTKVSMQSSKAKKKRKYDTCIYDYLQAHYDEVRELTFAENTDAENMESELTDFQNENGYEMVSGIADLQNLASKSSTLLTRIEEMYTSKNSYISAVRLSEQGNENEELYLQAVNVLSQMDPEDAMYESGQALIETETQNYLNAVCGRVDTYLAQEDFTSAKELLLKAQEKLPNNAVVSEKINQVMNSAAEKYAKQADTYFHEGDIDAAIGNIQVALQFAPENGDYQSRLENYQLYIPRPLYISENMLSVQRHISGSAYLDTEEYMTANTGDTLPNCIRFHQGTMGTVNSCSVTYNLGGKYDAISGVWARSQACKSQDGYEYFEVYGDGKLLYTSPRIGRDVLPQSVSCTVSGVQTLTVVFKGETNEWSCDSILSDFVARKTVS